MSWVSNKRRHAQKCRILQMMRVKSKWYDQTGYSYDRLQFVLFFFFFSIIIFSKILTVVDQCKSSPTRIGRVKRAVIVKSDEGKVKMIRSNKL